VLPEDQGRGGRLDSDAGFANLPAMAQDDASAFHVPPGLVAEVEAAATEEGRPACDIVREAIESYLKARRWQRSAAYGRERSRALGLVEADLPRLIAESREEARRAGRC
jgi:hypothetical protein